jgi:hypothetical protein
VILATGQVMPKIIHSTLQTVSSSWAIATAPQPQNIWKGRALIWEDSRDYLYARTTASGRIIIGGEDSDEVIEPEARDALIPEKSRILTEKLRALWPHASRDIANRWAGTFDTTSDGLLLISPALGKGRRCAPTYRAESRFPTPLRSSGAPTLGKLRKHHLEMSGCATCGRRDDVSRRARGDHLPAFIARAGTDIDDPVARRDDAHVVFHDNHRAAG